MKKTITYDVNQKKVQWEIDYIPVVGFMLYFLFYSRKLQKRFIKRLDNLKSHTYF